MSLKNISKRFGSNVNVGRCNDSWIVWFEQVETKLNPKQVDN